MNIIIADDPSSKLDFAERLSAVILAPPTIRPGLNEASRATAAPTRGSKHRRLESETIHDNETHSSLFETL